MKKRTGLVVIGIGTLVVLWALFRPERLFVNQKVNESLPTGSASSTAMPAASSVAPMALLTGQFHGVAHESKGNAAIYELPDGKRLLRLTDFRTSNGPDVQVYLVAASDATDSDTVKKAGFLPLGALKGNEGDQNYDVPADADLGKYRAVTIWCRRFGVNFATAPLGRAASGGTTAGMMNNAPVALLAGRFHSVAHESSGTATVYQLPDGKRLLRFTDFKTSNGPDVQVYLVAASDASDSDTDTVKKAGFLPVAALKGNEGDQNYELPAGADLAKYRAVTIWCRRFGVNFATAPLTQP